MPYRIIQVPSLGIEGAVALLVSTDWYQVRDTMYGTSQFYNPQTWANTMYLNHWGIYGVSPFTPCALFTTDAGTSVKVVTQIVTGFTLTPATDTVAAGDVLQLTPKLAATVTPTGTAIQVAPDAATYEIAANHAASGDDAHGAAFDLNANTFVDDRARLHVQRDGLVAGDVITVTGTATYVNPNGETTKHTATCTFTVE